MSNAYRTDPRIARLAVVGDQHGVPAEVDVLVLEMGERVDGDDSGRGGDRDVEHREPGGTGDERPVALEDHPEGRPRGDVAQVLDVG